MFHIGPHHRQGKYPVFLYYAKDVFLYGQVVSVGIPIGIYEFLLFS